jgi:hypothetical protein
MPDKLANELRATADRLEFAIERYGWSDKREADLGELLQSIGYALEDALRKAAVLVAGEPQTLSQTVGGQQAWDADQVTNRFGMMGGVE